MKRTRKQFILSSRNPELSKAVLKQCGVDWEDLIAYPYDYRDAGSGVSGFIYYSDTVPFAKAHLVPIMNALNELESDIGEPLKKPTGDETQFYNWLAWFALESVVDEIIYFKENQDD